MFMTVLPSNPESKEIFNLIALFFITTKVDAYKTSRPSQYFKCQNFGHSSIHCGHTTRCVKPYEEVPKDRWQIFLLLLLGRVSYSEPQKMPKLHKSNGVKDKKVNWLHSPNYPSQTSKHQNDKFHVLSSPHHCNYTNSRTK